MAHSRKEADDVAGALFQDDALQWESAPREAFLAFLARRAALGSHLEATSVRIYLGMFDRLCGWLDEAGRGLMTLDEGSLARFLDSRRLSDGTRHRYLLLFTALYRHLQAIEAARTNPTLMLMREAGRPDREAPESLLPIEVRALLTQTGVKHTWKHRRNEALILTFMSTGMRVRESMAWQTASALEALSCSSGKSVTIPGARAARKVPVLAVGRDVMKEWIKERDAMAIPGQCVFPANETGAPLAPSTIFRQARNRLERAGIVRRYEGPTLLRNTYGAIVLALHGLEAARMAMGHETLETTLLYAPTAKIWEQAFKSGSTPASTFLGDQEGAPSD